MYIICIPHIPPAALCSVQPAEALGPPQSPNLKQDTIRNRYALLIPTRLPGLLEWEALPALFLSEGLEGQVCHYYCTTAHTTLCSTNVEASAALLQLPEMRASQAVICKNEISTFSVVYSLTRHILLTLEGSAVHWIQTMIKIIAHISIYHASCSI